MARKKPLLEIIGIEKHFGAQHVLKNCSLDITQGETVVLIGPSGSGKSTLLRCVNLLEPFEGGSIFFREQDIVRSGVSPHRLRQEIGMVFQNYELFSHLTAGENIMLAPSAANRHAPRPRNCWARCVSPTRSTPFRMSFPAASSSGWLSPARWR